MSSTVHQPTTTVFRYKWIHPIHAKNGQMDPHERFDQRLCQVLEDIKGSLDVEQFHPDATCYMIMTDNEDLTIFNDFGEGNRQTVVFI